MFGRYAALAIYASNRYVIAYQSVYRCHMPDDAAAKYPPYIPLRQLKRPPYHGPGPTKAYELLRQRRLRAVRTPWGTMVTGESFAELMASMPKFESKEDAR